MRNPLFIVGAVMVAIGLFISAGKLRYTDTEKVADFGKLEIQASHEKTTPLNWGYVLIGGGAVLLVIGAMTRKS
jgi:hypothetical protein